MNRAVAALAEKEIWDEGLYVPETVSPSEKAQIEALIPEWVEVLLQSGIPLLEIAQRMSKPMRCVWIVNEGHLVDEAKEEEEENEESGDVKRDQGGVNNSLMLDSLEYAPIICVSASHVEQYGDGHRKGYSYVQGAADDEYTWSHGLTPELFWKNVEDILPDGVSQDECIAVVQNLCGNPSTSVENGDSNAHKNGSDGSVVQGMEWNEDVFLETSVLASTNLTVASVASSSISSSLVVSESLLARYSGIVVCSEAVEGAITSLNGRCLHVRVVDSKKKQDKMSLRNSLPFVRDFIHARPPSPETPLLFVSPDNMDIALAVALTASVLLDPPSHNGSSKPSKEGTRVRLAYLQSFAPGVFPSRHLLKQINTFLISFSQ